jgi:hypothetical protein
VANAGSRGPRVYLEAIGVGVTGTRRLSLDPIEGGAVAIPTLLPIVDLSQALIAVRTLQVNVTDLTWEFGSCAHIGRFQAPEKVCPWLVLQFPRNFSTTAPVCF